MNKAKRLNKQVHHRNAPTREYCIAKAPISTEERKLMAEALEIGNGIYGAAGGCEMTARELRSAKILISDGIDTPMLLLKMVCMGLEFMFWDQKQTPVGLVELFGKLERMTGYKRLGMVTKTLCEARRISSG